MGVFVVTGGTKGIGEQAIAVLRDRGHDVINIDVDRGEVEADLGTRHGREMAIAEIHKRCPDGLDGLVCNHGIAGLPQFKASYILATNYFGAVATMNGLFDLLKMKKGSCVASTSGAIFTAQRGEYYVDHLLTNCGDEERIGRLVDSFPIYDDLNVMYLSSKIALAAWVRRTSASWAANGVNINAVGPGGTATTAMRGFKKPDAERYYYPMPVLYGQNRSMYPVTVAQTLAFLVMPEAKGINGQVVFCDSGSSAITGTGRYF